MDIELWPFVYVPVALLALACKAAFSPPEPRPASVPTTD